MDTIINYVDNMFASLPKSTEMRQLRDELLANMEEKYHELKQAGKTDNEAIGIVISEFGNIDEIIEEFDISQEEGVMTKPLLTEQEVDNYLQVSKKSGQWIGIGAVLCIFGSAMFVLLLGLFENGYMNGLTVETGMYIGVIILLLCVAIAVGLFIYAGMQLDKYKYISVKGNFDLPIDLRSKIKTMNDAYQPTFTIIMIVGVVLIILSPAILLGMIALNDNMANFGVFIMLALVAVAVYLFVYFGNMYGAYDKLLKGDAKRTKEKDEDRVIGAVASIIWPLAVIVFLISGFIYGLWYINWIVFPITGLLFAMFSGAYSILVNKEE
ncbi:permease prefix domain 1-containing protein [Gracilibacillus saliphilus]|uniref:permease prefix domain 1-containing protein n=1 Tax=Gracilibacillus saliphilus TaxID=543890 RepID=UPI0013D1A5D2|nr:permease prefix domain 1-containing protein [Gracilibacillus saliphilus]